MDSLRRIALPGEMQKQDRVQIRDAGDVANGVERLFVGEMPCTVHDPLLQEVGSIALELHRPVVVRLECQHVDIGEMLKQRFGNMAEIGGESDAVFMELESVRGAAGVVVGQ